MIKGEAKKQYQREYMRKRREAQKTACQGALQSTNSVRPMQLDPCKQNKNSVIEAI